MLSRVKMDGKPYSNVGQFESSNIALQYDIRHTGAHASTCTHMGWRDWGFCFRFWLLWVKSFPWEDV